MADQSVGEAAEDKAHAYGRPLSIEDVSNRFFIHPLSDVIVTVGVKFGLSPNLVSLVGLGLGILAAVLYYDLPAPAQVFGAFAAMLGWHILDGADGRLARATGKTSAFGRILDGICDHLVFTAVYLAFAFQIISAGAPLTIWWLVVAAGLSHAVQAAGYEERRQKYQRRLNGVSRKTVEEKLLTVGGKKSALAAIYDLAQKAVAGRNYGLDAKLATLRANGGDVQAAALVAKTVPMVRAWGLLNANNRTFLIFAFALAGLPIWYFIFEVVVLNLVLLWLLFREKNAEHVIIAQIPSIEAA